MRHINLSLDEIKTLSENFNKKSFQRYDFKTEMETDSTYNIYKIGIDFQETLGCDIDDEIFEDSKEVHTELRFYIWDLLNYIKNKFISENPQTIFGMEIFHSDSDYRTLKNDIDIQDLYFWNIENKDIITYFHIFVNEHIGIKNCLNQLSLRYKISLKEVEFGIAILIKEFK